MVDNAALLAVAAELAELASEHHRPVLEHAIFKALAEAYEKGRDDAYREVEDADMER